MVSDEDDATIVRSTIELGRNLGLRVVAEDEHVDGVSALVILATLAGVTRELWDAARRSDDEGLLLKSHDLVDPEASEMLDRLSRSPEPAGRLVRLLRDALAAPLGPCPQLEEGASLYGVRLRPFVAERQRPSTSKDAKRRERGKVAASTRQLLMTWELESGLGDSTASTKDIGESEPVPPRTPALPAGDTTVADHAASVVDVRLTRRQILTLASTAAGLEVERIAELRNVGPAAVRRQLALLSRRVELEKVSEVLGFELSPRQAEVTELRLAGASESECAERLGLRVGTARRHLKTALRRIETSTLKAAQDLAAVLRALDEAPVTPSSAAEPRVSRAPAPKAPGPQGEGEPVTFPEPAVNKGRTTSLEELLGPHVAEAAAVAILVILVIVILKIVLG
jgi:DNA-binding CsgD family transcriptional regulator